MNQFYRFYIQSFKGLSPEVWWLALISLINRAGTMVIPFLSLYLNKSLDFSLVQVGWVMTIFGVGSFTGSWLGGKLTDKIGSYKVMIGSLVSSGILFLVLQTMTSFWSFGITLFFVMLTADTFRPAMFVALSSYSKPENKTRSVTLIRLAINLGFSAGPALGGWIIHNMGYEYLFWLDGSTCILAGLLLFLVLNPKKTKVLDTIENDNPISAWSDKSFLLFLLSLVFFGIVFLQYFSTVPLFYKEVAGLEEDTIGILLAINGFFIFLFEMPLIKYLESKNISELKWMLIGLGMIIASIGLLLSSTLIWVLIIGILLMSLGEMIAFPFSNAFVMKKAKNGNQGQYMGLYSISFSIAHIIGHNLGMQSIELYGYNNTWITMIVLAFVSFILIRWVQALVQNQRS
jgi:predicted MFS family arabinose efflux permease